MGKTAQRQVRRNTERVTIERKTPTEEQCQSRKRVKERMTNRHRLKKDKLKRI